MLRNYREVLALGGVRVLLLAAAVSIAGDSAAMVALLLRVHDAGAGPWAVSALLLAFGLPVVLLMGPAGTLADRPDPRRLLAATASVQALAALGLALVDGLVATFVLVLVLQTAFALGSPAWTALVPRLVPDGSAGRVVALQQALRGVAAPLGAGVGGLLVQWHGPATALLLDALTFVLLAGGAALVPRPRPLPATDDAQVPVRGLLPRAGIRALRADPALGVLVLALLPMVVTIESVNVVEVFLVRDVLGAGAAQFGAAEAVHGVAAVLGAVAAGAASTRRARIRVVLWAIGLVGLGQVAQGLAPSYPVYLAGSVGVGLMLGAVNALVFGLLLDELEPGRHGAVVALVSGLSRAAGALALGLGGAVGSLAGARTAYVVAGVAGLVVALAATLAVHRSVDGASTARASRGTPGPSTLEA
ncbi:MFS transporter [Phycicoccus sp. MAQZ13P-2]|uniref:MFS transporter n=1 Tax=Phycicoccus mangrovi TaxID=2840470 RepID=UPI001C0089A9|nr:MFS transporter [Phycicoccus mangrovi]MBT9256694.1 MFS transporter [Phycicoccus mangrovi]MBT9274742.1 MFS transporter [Phycicoccus mangrovi]